MKLLSIQTGIKKEYKKEEKTFESSYVKTKALLPQHIGAEGFEKDTQTDKRYHGGETKAIMVYSVDNYKFFQKSLDLEKLSNGVFGENFSVTGLNESNVNIGDKFTIGEVIVEVSQPREPCWKVSYFLGHPDGAKAMYNSGKTGWYFRVLQSGIIDKNDTITLLEKADNDLTIENLNFLLNKQLVNEDLLDLALKNEKLGEPFKKALEKRKGNS